METRTGVPTFEELERFYWTVIALHLVPLLAVLAVCVALFR